ncbi:phosphoenolpyruvate synthase [Halobellus sp. Atlit-31R]|nr:phosphoenolpyruvate synthase [Halobellus sp. Atlit-31R]
MTSQQFVRWLDDVSGDDVGSVGGKSANLGELAGLDVPVLPGFTTTAAAYEYYIDEAGIRADVEAALDGLDVDDVRDLRSRGERIRQRIREATMPPELAARIVEQYEALARELGTEDPSVAVRSSATAEDLPTASFAGQQDTFLDVTGREELIEAVQGCYASLFTDRAIAYREHNGFDHFAVRLACVVQKMGQADLGASGVLFTLDPDSGFENVVVAEAAYGFGELIVQGEVDPDRYVVFKPTNGIVEKRLGGKAQRMVRRDGETAVEDVPEQERGQYALSDDQIRTLATYAERIEAHFERPMDVEWLLDGDLDQLFVVQARPETVHGAAESDAIRTYRLTEEAEPRLEGVAIGSAIASGRVRLLDDVGEMDRFRAGDVLVTGMTAPDWVPIMRRASAIVTERGGKTSHAAIVSRELGVPAVVGTERATKVLRDGDTVTVDCSGETGYVYDGEVAFESRERSLADVPSTDTDVMLILGDPSRAFSLAGLPVDGVGLVREEFIITTHVGTHPLAMLERGAGEEYIAALQTGIAKIAAAFHPDPVVVRLSDFKTDEYRHLDGGRTFEHEEANPMLGWRGASRYYDESFREAFRLECEALRRVREDVGLDNVTVMVPFCRTPAEGRRVLGILDEYGLSGDDLDVFVMAELPSNVVLADRFADLFDGFSIGSNDLTQLLLGVDRNSRKLASLFDERDEAVERSIRSLIEEAHGHDRPVGICGDAPSTVPGYVDVLIDAGIDSISVTPDAVLETIERVSEAEERSS